MPERHPSLLPFSALVGQPTLRRALVMMAVNPRLDGLLIRGEKGTAKSTAARAVAALLPELHITPDCPFSCARERPQSWCDDCREHGIDTPVLRAPHFETLPLGVTEDQILGTLDLEHALQHGERRFQPGILARVNNGVLYVDEVNLLEDPVVDVLLDVSSSGVNVIAREGFALSHPAEFVLIGTMNPEEGELRPQLLDRFGLCVDIETLEDPAERAEIVVRRLAFEADPSGFRASYEEPERALRQRIVEARALLPGIEIHRDTCEAAARIALALEVAGHRADILLVKSGATLAALDGRSEIADQDLIDAASVVVPHRLRRRPFDDRSVNAAELRSRAEAALKEKKSLEADEDAGSEHAACAERSRRRSGGQRASSSHGHDGYEQARGTRRDRREEPSGGGLLTIGLFGDRGALELEESAIAELDDPTRPISRAVPAGRRQARRSLRSHRPFRGRHRRSKRPEGRPRDLDWTATLKDWAVGPATSLGLRHLRVKERIESPQRVVLFVVDASGSMGGDLTALARQSALHVLQRAYQRREEVAMIAFRSERAELLFAPTRQTERVQRAFESLPLGGTTPLAAGLACALQTLTRAARSGAVEPVLVLLSDGRANVGSRPGHESVLAEVDAVARALAAVDPLRIVFLDVTKDGKNDAPARALAASLGARAERIRLATLVRTHRDPALELAQRLDATARAPHVR